MEKAQAVTLLTRYANLGLAKLQVKPGLMTKKQNGRDAHAFIAPIK
jgi:hypothetical protein